MMYRPFGLPRQAILATALALIGFHSGLLSVGASGSSPAIGVRELAPAVPFSVTLNQAENLSAASAPQASSPSPLAKSLNRSSLHSETLPLSHSATLSQAPSQTGAITEIRALFAEYIRLHAAKKIDEWRDKMFLPEAICVQTLNDGKVRVYQIEELAKIVADEAKSLDEQHEVFEDVRIEVYGNAAQYATGWKLFQNKKEVSKGRAFFSLVKKEGAWKIASLVWYRD